MGVESKVVLAKLKDIGEFVNSASSSVAPPVARKVKAAFAAEGVKPGGKDDKATDAATSAKKAQAKPAAKPAKPAKPGAAAGGAAPKPGGGSAKSAAPKPGATSAAAKPGAPKPADGAPKPGAAKPADGAPKPGAAKPAAPKPADGAPKPGAAKPGAPKPGGNAPKPGAPKPGPHPGNNPFATSQGMGIPRPPRPGNNPYSAQQGMGRNRPNPGSIPRPSRQESGLGRPGGPRPGGQGRPGGGGAGRGRPGAAGGGGGRPGFGAPRPGGFGGGRGRPGRGAGTAGAFGRGGSRGKSRKSKRAKRQEFELQSAPSIGGVQVPRGDGNTRVRLRRGASLMDFAEKINTSASNLVTVLFHLGEMATATESLDEATFEILGEELGYKIQIVSPEDEDREILEEFGIDLEAELAEEDEAQLLPRPPVVTVMGHVDHGKTSLLDAIRKADVGGSEAGGITQHIGAYQVAAQHEGETRKITFIDTPGHEAFTAMRARGAQVTDIAILVVAADDGIMPQTVEALNHAKAAEVPVVVAVNKVDKPEANPAKVRQQLTEFDLVAEEYGGDVMFVDVSAKNNIGITDLLDAVLLTADAGLELQANPDTDARGVAIEAHLDKGRGSVATVLIEQGTLRVGDAIVTGTAYGRVRAMLDENGENVEEAGPSRPVQVQGLSSVPRAGDNFIVTEDDRTARQIAERREAAERNAMLAKARKRMSLEDFTKALEEGEIESLNLIIKGDVSGAVEALEESLMKIEIDDSVQLRILHRGVGAITASDVDLATIDNAIILGFNVRPDVKARERAQQEGVDIRFYSVIYDAIESVEKSLKGLLKPEYEEVQSGVAEIREVFRSSKFGNIAGVIVRSGTITRNAKARVIRDGVVVADNLAIESLRRFKDDVTEVKTDFEAGIGLGKFNDIQIGDEIETTEMVEKPRD